MQSAVRSYTDEQILKRAASLPSFRGFPDKYWVVGIRSEEDVFNRPDDKFYLFKGKKFVMVCKGTTNAGSDMLHPTNRRGEGVIKAEEIYYDVWERKFHRGKVLAYCQVKPMLIHRDNDGDRRTEELGTPKWEIGGFNFHPMDYRKGSRTEREFIGGWSLGCQCPSIRADFDEIMKFTDGQKRLTYCLLNEFEP